MPTGGRQIPPTNLDDLAGQARAIEGEAVQGAEDGYGDLVGAEEVTSQGLHLVERDGFDGSEDFVKGVEAAEVE